MHPYLPLISHELKHLLALDLAFLLDASSSMQPFIDLVKNKIISISSGIAHDHPQCLLRVAFVVYRDYTDKVHSDCCDFTSSFEGTFVSTLSRHSFQHLNDSTYKMLQEFKKASGKKDWIDEDRFDMDTRHQIPRKVVDICSATISKTLSSVIKGGGAIKSKQIVPCHVESTIPEWSRIGQEEGRQYKYKWYGDLQELLGIVGSGRSLELERMGHVQVKIAPHPFSDARATRWPYYAELDDYSRRLSMVVKRFKMWLGEDTRKVHAKE